MNRNKCSLADDHQPSFQLNTSSQLDTSANELFSVKRERNRLGSAIGQIPFW